MILKASTLNLFNKVVHYDGASGFNGYIETVKIYYTTTTGLFHLVLLLLERHMKSMKSRKGVMVAL